MIVLVPVSAAVISIDSLSTWTIQVAANDGMGSPFASGIVVTLASMAADSVVWTGPSWLEPGVPGGSALFSQLGETAYSGSMTPSPSSTRNCWARKRDRASPQLCSLEPSGANQPWFCASMNISVTSETMRYRTRVASPPPGLSVSGGPQPAPPPALMTCVCTGTGTVSEIPPNHDAIRL